MSACGCIGPQNGDPLCPCMMRGVKIRDGRYIREDDLGPVKPDPAPVVSAQGCICPPGSEATCQGPFCPRKPWALRALAGL